MGARPDLDMRFSSVTGIPICNRLLHFSQLRCQELLRTFLSSSRYCQQFLYRTETLAGIAGWCVAHFGSEDDRTTIEAQMQMKIFVVNITSSGLRNDETD
jgi:hypothetical protein